MGKWTKKTWLFGKAGERGKIEVWYDDGDPPAVKIVVFTDPDGTVHRFDRRKPEASITPKGGKETPKKGTLKPDHKKSQTYTFDGEDWEIVIRESGVVVWKKKNKAGKDDNDTFDPGAGKWDKDNPPKEWPPGKNNVGPKSPSEEKVDEPKSP